MYVPYAWVVVKLNIEQETHYKILADFGDEWRLSSGIVQIVDCDHFYKIYNYSGSVYHCYKDSQRMSGYTEGIYTAYKFDHNIETVDIGEICEQYS
jgi:hypothetical protein